MVHFPQITLREWIHPFSEGDETNQMGTIWTKFLCSGKDFHINLAIVLVAPCLWPISVNEYSLRYNHDYQLWRMRGRTQTTQNDNVTFLRARYIWLLNCYHSVPSTRGHIQQYLFWADWVKNGLYCIVWVKTDEALFSCSIIWSQIYLS